MIFRSLIIAFLVFIVARMFVFNVRDIRASRNDMDHLQECFRGFHNKIPSNSEIHYLSNYKAEVESAMYFQAQFASAPNLLLKYDTTSSENKLLVLVTDKRQEFVLDPGPVTPGGFNLLDTFVSDNFNVKLYRRIRP